MYFSEVLGGTYTKFGRTEDKDAQLIVVDGLDPNTEYFFYVQTVTEPHGWNSNTVFSDTTEVIWATTDL